MKRNFSIARILVFCVAILLSVGSTHAQGKIVSGRVTSDGNNSPLAGISVLVKGTNIGVSSDAQGRYSLTIPKANATIVFSFTGYTTQEIDVSDKKVVNVQMAADLKELSEVVVTAFGIEKSKKALTYSTQVVDGSKLTEARETNVVNSLKGRVAGLHVNPSSGGPGGSSYVMIRGNSSLTGNGQPLYVVDGVPIDNQTLDAAQVWGGRDYGDGINNINPDDIENVTVLKVPGVLLYMGQEDQMA